MYCNSINNASNFYSVNNHLTHDPLLVLPILESGSNLEFLVMSIAWSIRDSQLSTNSSMRAKLVLEEKTIEYRAIVVRTGEA